MLRRIPHDSHGSFNPHVITNKEAHIINGNMHTFGNVTKDKGLAKLGNIVVETLLRRQMFPSLAARETYVAATNFAARKQKMFLPEVKNIFVSRTQILRPKQMFPSLATTKTVSI